MDIKELKTSFDEISKQVKKETKGQPVLATLFNTLLSLFKILFELFAEQSKKFEEQNRLIEKLTGQYANKAFDSRKANDETINGRRSEKKKASIQLIRTTIKIFLMKKKRSLRKLSRPNSR